MKKVRQITDLEVYHNFLYNNTIMIISYIYMYTYLQSGS